MLFVVLRQLTGRQYASLLVAALFALHPLNVDSVAWAAERKNLLSTFFWMVSLLFYSRYVHRPNFARYLLTVISFVLGLMTKPMLVTLPFVFLLLDFWPLERARCFPIRNRALETAPVEKPIVPQTSLSKLVLEKMPFLFLSFGSVWLSILSSRHIDNMVATDTVPMLLRMGNALVSYTNYIGKMFWPLHLAVYYPFPETIPPSSVIGAAVLLASATALVLCLFQRKPSLAIGWFWFLGTLVPAIGIVQNGLWPAMADRWAYVPMIGLFIVISWGLADLAAKWPKWKPAFIILTFSLIAFFAVATRTQLGHWKNSITLFEHALAVTEDNHIAQNNLGNAFAEKGNFTKAIYHYRESIRLKPNNAKAYNNLGIALARQGQIEAAIQNYSRAVSINSGYAPAFNNLGAALTAQGRIEDAILNFLHSIELKPDYAEAHNNLGVALKKQGNISMAVEHYFKASRLDPNYAAPYYNLGLAFYQIGRIGQAIDYFQKALQIKPTYENARQSLDLALVNQRRLKPENAKIRNP